MTIEIDHITIPARDKVATMNWMAELLGVEAGPVVEPFAIVELDGCTLDYVDSEEIQMQHVALRLDDDEFDAMYHRMVDAGIDIFGHPQDQEDPAKGKIYYQDDGGRGFYFKDPDGHMMEIKTARDNPRRSGGYDFGPFRPAKR
jgi:catechol 2,3-dioxygenase-like lactoylglutathione lyase family enzyme